MSTSEFDIVIVGAGLVGSAFALMLAEQGLNVAIAEAKAATPKKGLGKAIALSHTSIDIFSHLDLWSSLSAQATAIKQVHVSQKNHFGTVKLKASEAGVDFLGQLINEPDLSRVISTAAAKAKLTWFRPATVTNVELNDEGARVTLQTQDDAVVAINTTLLIAADGQHSSLKKLLCIPSVEKDYGEQALVCRLSITGQHEFTAFERFTEKGTLALMPQSGQQVALIISAKNAIADEWLALDDDMFLKQLQTMFGYRLGRFLAKDQLRSFPLKHSIAQRQVDHAVILLGASAHSFHPIAAQGLNLCLREAKLLSELIAKTDAPLSKVPLQYQQQVIGIQKPVMRMTEMVAKQAADTGFSAQIKRQLGLLAFEYSDLLKQRLLKTGLGKVM